MVAMYASAFLVSRTEREGEPVRVSTREGREEEEEEEEEGAANKGEGGEERRWWWWGLVAREVEEAEGRGGGETSCSGECVTRMEGMEAASTTFYHQRLTVLKLTNSTVLDSSAVPSSCL